MKACTKQTCKQVNPQTMDQFRAGKTWCRSCFAEYGREHRAKNADKHRAYRQANRVRLQANGRRSREKNKLRWAQMDPVRYRAQKQEIREQCLMKNFGIDLSTYNRLLTAQDHKCAICWTPAVESRRSLDVDHDHKTGQIRGILCSNCNIGLGYFRDNQGYLGEAIKYLKGSK